MAKATIGRLDPCWSPAADHKAVMPSVKIIGSPTSHSTPMFSRPNRVMTSRISSAQMTRRWIAKECRNDMPLPPSLSRCARARWRSRG
jgi:hypothetical protein